MAILSNTLYTIELGSKIWLHIINSNFDKIYSITTLDGILVNYSDTIHTHIEYKLRTIAEGEVRTAIGSTFIYDIASIGAATGVVFLDRTTGTYQRMYVSGGVLQIEGE